MMLYATTIMIIMAASCKGDSQDEDSQEIMALDAREQLLNDMLLETLDKRASHSLSTKAHYSTKP